MDLAVMLADGGQAITDLATRRDQAQLFGPVASDPTAWRLLSKLDGQVLGGLATHRHGTPILIRSDSAGCTHGPLAHIRSLRDPGLDTRFSVGVAITEPIRQAILTAKQRPGDWVAGRGHRR